jgi:hypothetical protein
VTFTDLETRNGVVSVFYEYNKNYLNIPPKPNAVTYVIDIDNLVCTRTYSGYESSCLTFLKKNDFKEPTTFNLINSTFDEA